MIYCLPIGRRIVSGDRSREGFHFYTFLICVPWVYIISSIIKISQIKSVHQGSIHLITVHVYCMLTVC